MKLDFVPRWGWPVPSTRIELIGFDERLTSNAEAREKAIEFIKGACFRRVNSMPYPAADEHYFELDLMGFRYVITGVSDGFAGFDPYVKSIERLGHIDTTEDGFTVITKNFREMRAQSENKEYATW